MKNKNLYIIFVILAVLALVWNTCGSDKQIANHESTGKKMNSEFIDIPSTNQANKVDNNQNQSRFEKIRDFLRTADVEINFYGRVIDQEGMGVEGATINYQLERAWELMADGNLTKNNQKATCLSANDGLFSIKGAKGLTLTILSIEKEGYRDGKQNLRSFGYRGTPDLHNASSKKPVNFLLISNNIPKTKILYDKSLTFSWNQGPVEIPIPKVGKIMILPQRDWKPGQLRNFDWQVEISMDGAELVEIEMGQAKIAPKDGYQKSFIYGSKKEDLLWGGAVQRHYAFRTNSSLYGFIGLMLRANRDDGNQSTELEVRLNEAGSRSLD